MTFCELNKYTNILVTGGAGFIGSNFIRKLLLNYKNNIFNLDKLGYASDLSPIKDIQSKLGEDSIIRHNLLNVDLVESYKVDKALETASPDLIIHFAAESHVDNSIDNPINFINSNLVGTFNLLMSAKKYWMNLEINKKQKFKLIHVSTDEVFGSLSKYGSFSEDSIYNPSSPYSDTKAGSDHLVKAWYKTYGLPVIVTNCSNNFGPWQHREKLIPLTLSKIFNNQKIPIYGNGQNVRDWLFVEDHIDALIKVIERGSIGESYCIGGKEEVSNIELVKLICEIMDKKINRKSSSVDLIEFVSDRPGHDFRYSINSTKINSHLGWKQNYSLEQGLQITIDWFLDKNKFKIMN